MSLHKQVAIANAIVLSVASGLSAGTISFAPQGPATVPAGTPVAFSVDLSATASFNFVDILMGSADAADYSFTTDPAWNAAFGGSSSVIYDEPNALTENVFISAYSAAPTGPSLAVGLLTIDTTNLTPGVYVVAVSQGDSYTLADGGEGGDADVLSGFGTYVVTPEPSALTLLALGAALALRRR